MGDISRCSHTFCDCMLLLMIEDSLSGFYYFDLFWKILLPKLYYYSNSLCIVVDLRLMVTSVTKRFWSQEVHFEDKALPAHERWGVHSRKITNIDGIIFGRGGVMLSVSGNVKDMGLIRNHCYLSCVFLHKRNEKKIVSENIRYRECYTNCNFESNWTNLYRVLCLK